MRLFIFSLVCKFWVRVNFIKISIGFSNEPSHPLTCPSNESKRGRYYLYTYTMLKIVLSCTFRTSFFYLTHNNESLSVPKCQWGSVTFSKVADSNSTELHKASYKGAHLVERGPGVWTPTLFRYSRNCTLIFLNRFRRNVLKNQFKKRKNPKRCTNSIL